MSQIKSKKRVADHGEVFTSEREINSMLDLVKQETENIEHTHSFHFPSPCCRPPNISTKLVSIVQT